MKDICRDPCLDLHLCHEVPFNTRTWGRRRPVLSTMVSTSSRGGSFHLAASAACIVGAVRLRSRLRTNGAYKDPRLRTNGAYKDPRRSATRNRAAVERAAGLAHAYYPFIFGNTSWYALFLQHLLLSCA